MLEMHLKQPGFTYSSCGPFTKNKKRIEKFKETGDTSYIYKNELDRACFQHNMAYRDFKDLARRTASDKVLIDKAFNIAKNPKYDGYQRDLDILIKSLLYLQINLPKVVVLIMKSNKMSNWLKNYTTQTSY